MLTTIVAVSRNNVIGKDNKLVWSIPEDLRRFKKLTMGKKIIMGRKTFESLGRILPNRTHIVITRDTEYKNNEDIKLNPKVIIVSSVKEAINLVSKDEEAFIIGGGEIYEQTMDLVDKIELTRLNVSVEGDVLFPVIDENKWVATEEVHHYQFSFITYKRK